MSKINVRQLLREFKSIFPIPEAGIDVVSRGKVLFRIVRQTGMSDKKEVMSDNNMSDKYEGEKKTENITNMEKLDMVEEEKQRKLKVAREALSKLI